MGRLSREDLLERVASWENLLLAYRRAALGKRGRGDVARFEHRLEDELFALRRELLDRSYRPGAYASFYVHEPKRRLISAALFRDRVIHHALCNVIEPFFERSFLDDSYANRKERGTHTALQQAQLHARRHPYVLQVDVRQFFPSIDHAILRDLLARKLLGTDVLWLADRILESGAGVLAEEYSMVYFHGDDLFAVNRPRGLPIGNLTSQFWANVYLNPIDHFVKRELRCPGYVRYVDDLLLFGDAKACLWRSRALLEERLACLRLTIHRGSHPRPVTEGIPFLGFRIFPEGRRLKRRKGVQYERHLHASIAAWQTGQRSAEDVAASLRGWCNHARYANTVGLRKAMLAAVPSPIRRLVADAGR